MSFTAGKLSEKKALFWSVFNGIRAEKDLLYKLKHSVWIQENRETRKKDLYSDTFHAVFIPYHQVLQITLAISIV